MDIQSINKTEPKESHQLIVTCSVTSYPEVSNNDITWTKQNNATFNRKGQKLVIDSVHRVDKGIYVCVVVLELIPTRGQSVNVTGTTTVEVNVLCKYCIRFVLNTYKRRYHSKPLD